MADLNQAQGLSVLESRSAPGIFLVTAWVSSSADLARVLSDWAAQHPDTDVVYLGERHSEIESLRANISGSQSWNWIPAENVTEGERMLAVREVFVAEGWLLSLDGATAWAAAGKMKGVRLVIDFSAPLASPAEISKALGVAMPLRFPAGTRVGGIIIPQ
jgi:hypothetical protein